MTTLIGDMARSIGLPALKQAAGAVTRWVPIPQPLMMVGPGASERLGRAIGDFGHRKLFVVTDASVARLGLAEPALRALAGRGTPFEVFDRVTPDAPLPEVEEGIECFLQADCDAVLAIGGGSVMDAAKAIALSAASGRHPRALAGYFRSARGPCPIYAVPTTAGTGSEVTVAAVVGDLEHARKLVIVDTRIVPRMAALDPALMTGLPAPVTAATGMDALTHAVEAYIGGWKTEFSDRMARAAVGMIFEALPRAFANGQDLAARETMALASTYAGLAFTRANVGNVHAIAHQLGGRYHTPHGLANAIMLPPVLRFSLQAAQDKLAELALHVRLGTEGEGAAALARRFVEAVAALSAGLGIPDRLDALRAVDIPTLAQAACHEADANYPVPRVMSQADCEALLREVLPRRAPARVARRPARGADSAPTPAPAATARAGGAKKASAAAAKKARAAPRGVTS